MIRVLPQTVSIPLIDEQLRSNPFVENQTDDTLNIRNEFSQNRIEMLAFEGLQRRAQLEALLSPQTNSLNAPKATAYSSTFSSAAIKTKSGNEIDDETNRVLDNYHRQIKPSEIKGARPVAAGLPAGHSESKHGVKVEVQADILNKPDRIFSGINDNGRFVDIYYKNGSVVITEFGEKERVITAYGLIDKRKANPKPVKVGQFENNPRYVEIKLEGKGTTNVVYPNRERWDARDFPKNPPKPENLPKTNGGVTNGSQKSPVANEPPVKPTTTIPPEDAPVPKPLGGAANNISRGIILLQLVQLGLAAHDISRLKADGEKFGYYVDPFFSKYILTDPDKAAKNLPEGFELKFYPDPKDFYSQGQSITFQVKDGKFVNVDKNYPDYRLYIGADGLVTAGVMA